MSTLGHNIATSTTDSNGSSRARPRERGRSFGHFSLSLTVAVLIIWSWNGSDFDLQKLATSGTRILEFLGRMLPPDLSVLPVVIESSAETLRIAQLKSATIISDGSQFSA